MWNKYIFYIVIDLKNEKEKKKPREHRTQLRIVLISIQRSKETSVTYKVARAQAQEKIMVLNF